MMWKKAFFYSGLIWIIGLIVGDMMLVPFFISEPGLIGVAALFSFVGSLVPLMILVPIVRFLMLADFDPLGKALGLGIFVAIATIVPVMLLFGGFVNYMNAENLIFALPYIAGLWIGIALGYKKYFKSAIPQPDMEKLIHGIGRGNV